MPLDVPTLILTRNLNVLAVALTMACLLDWRHNLTARFAVAGMLLQALSWGLLMTLGQLSLQPLRPLMSVVAITLLMGSLWLIWQSLRIWLARPPLSIQSLAWMALAAAATIAGLGGLPVRNVIGNGALALLLILITVDLLRPNADNSRGWRYLIAGCMALAAGVSVLRGAANLMLPAEYAGLQADHPINVAGLVVSNITSVLIAVGVLLAYREEAERQLHRLAVTDGLTGVLNRRAWAERAMAMHAEARRYGHPLIMLMIDLDRFKHINDEYGHAVGDRALQLVGRLLQDELRAGDLIGRYGGEEFCLLLSHLSEASAEGFDRRLRERLGTRSSAVLSFRLDYSAGLAALRPTDKSLDDLIKRADDALYEAKRAGRARLVRAG